MNKPNVIYIMGCGRSGTTILDLLLGNHSGFLSVGEINGFRKAWRENKICSCGLAVTRCEIWQQIGDMFFDNKDQFYYDKMFDFQITFERQRAIWKQFLRVHKQSEINEYYSYVHKIFSVLQEISSCCSIIDSSKSIGRAIALLRNNRVNTRIIHLVRDPRGLYTSYQKRDVITPSKNLRLLATYWNGTNFIGELIRLYYGHKRVIRIHYEDLVSNPNKTISRIQNFLNEDLRDLMQKIDCMAPIERGHIASGNRVRTQQSFLTLKPDFAWKKKLSTYHKTILTILCFPLMIAYGYLHNRKS